MVSAQLCPICSAAERNFGQYNSVIGRERDNTEHGRIDRADTAFMRKLDRFRSKITAFCRTASCEWEMSMTAKEITEVRH